MKIKSKRVKEGFLIPLVDELKDKEEIIVEIKEESTEFLDFLKKYMEMKKTYQKYQMKRLWKMHLGKSMIYNIFYYLEHKIWPQYYKFYSLEEKI